MIPTETVSLKNFERMERGLPPKAQPKRKVEEPKPPVVPDQIFFKDIPEDDIYEFNARMRRGVKNEAGTRFTGYTIYLETRKGKVLEGWMAESDFEQLRGRLRVEAPHLLQNIGL